VQVFQTDVSNPKAIPLLFERVLNQFPALNVLINNAGIMRKINLASFESGAGNGLEDISREIETNPVGPVRMVAQFCPS
jgi:uncharacterized oxidoreductase